MNIARRLVASLTLLISPMTAVGQEKSLEPRPVNLVHDAITLSDALKSLQEQTGNEIADRRKNHRENPRLKLSLKNVTFWQALDVITAEARCGYSLYHEDGKVALVDAPSRKRRPTVAYAGICRLAVKRISLIRDEESGEHFCNVLAELAWEPRFHPFYLDVGSAEALFDKAESGRGQVLQHKIVGPGQTRLDDRCAAEFELRFPAPPRACPEIKSLACQLKLVGPAKMLTFRLPDLKPAKDGVMQVQDNVKVMFKPLLPRRERWSFDVIIENPPGSYRFESYQERDWLMHNKIFLEKVDGGKTTVIAHQPEGERPVPDDPFTFSFKRAAFRYDFTGDMPETNAGWSLVYRTPGPIVDVPLRFTLENIRLP